MSTWWPPLGFALLGTAAGLLGLLRRRGTWPLARRSTASPARLDTPSCGPPSIWHAGVLQAVDPPAFSALCEAMFRQDGCDTATAPTAIPGTDFLLHRRDGVPAGHRAVRCRPAREAAGIERCLRAFAGDIVAARAEGGVFITADHAGSAAIALARQHAIALVDGPALLKLIVQRSERQQRALRQVANPPTGKPMVRFSLEPTPAATWFAVAIAGFMGMVITWPSPRPGAPLQMAGEATAGLETAGPFIERPDDADREPARRPRAVPATAADLDPTPAVHLAPAAGRQVLRCVEAGRVSYLAADATCPQGEGERVTVFPTAGVNPYR